MDNMEEKLGNILQNPEMMQKIMSMAQALGSSQPQEPQQQSPEWEQPTAQLLPDLDMDILKKLSGLAGQSGIDPQQRNLLKALHPYLSPERIRKLENAMRAAKMARLAAAVLGTQGNKLLSFR